MTGPDTNVLRALVGLILRTFPPKGDYFYSFPRTSRAYSTESLDFLDPTGPTFDRSQAFGEISELVNRLTPAPGLFDLGADSPHLWDVYAQILSSGEAVNSNSDQAVKDLNEVAMDSLYQTPDHTEMTPVHASYLELRDTFRLADAAWNAAGRPDPSSLKDRADDSLTDWEIVGRRAEVEGWKSDVRAFYETNGRTLFDRLRSDWDPNNAATWKSFGDLRFLPTLLSPGDVTTAPWLDVTYEQSDLAKLSEGGFGTPQSLWGEPDKASTLKRMTVQLLEVDVLRPWWKSEILESRLWRFPPGVEPLVTSPPKSTGVLQGIIVGLVLVRGLGVTYKTQPATPPELGFMRPVSLRDTRAAQVLRMRTHLAAMIQPNDLRSPRGRDPWISMPEVHSPAVPSLAVSLDRAMLAAEPIDLRVSPDHVLLLAESEVTRLQKLFPRRTITPLPPVLGPSQPTPPEQGEWQMVIDQGVTYIAAFRCRRIRGPVPNPGSSSFN